MREAAIFDLDRTLLVGASGPVLSDALQEAGLRSGSIPGERLLFEVFNRIGETLPSMAITRQ
ncbi:MAG: HAD-IB family hydrolase, partial [Ilumatobacteraceae bacterium]